MDLDDFINIRHHLHKHPELSSFETRTSAFIQSFFEKNCPGSKIYKIGTTSLLIQFKGTHNQPAVLLRCELDALPIQESNTFEYKSINNSTSHKCGHDGHMTILTRVGIELKKKPPSGDVFLLFQSAEETGEGALEVLNSKVFINNCTPEYIFSLHNIPGEPMNSIHIKSGTFSTAVISIEIELNGITAHAGEPEKGINPTYALSAIWQRSTQLQKWFSKKHEKCKITSIYAQVGTRDFGISAGTAKAGFTLRSNSNTSLDKLKKEFLNELKQICSDHIVNMTYNWTQDFPSIFNNKSATNLIFKTGEELEMSITSLEHPFPWGEDFGHFTKNIKGAMFGIGSGQDTPPLHNPAYDFPDDLIIPASDFFIHLIRNSQNG